MSTKIEHEIMTRDELAKFLRVQPRAIYSLTRSRAKNPLPTLRLGIGLRWRRVDVDAWLQRAAA
jgi:predicted DNA-binding transcriptional regulator AlpA